MRVVCHRGYRTAGNMNSYLAICQDNHLFERLGECVKKEIGESEVKEGSEFMVGSMPTSHRLLLMAAVFVGLVVIVLGARVRTD